MNVITAILFNIPTCYRRGKLTFTPTPPKCITITVTCPLRNSPFVHIPLHKAKTFSKYSKHQRRGRSNPFRKKIGSPAHLGKSHLWGVGWGLDSKWNGRQLTSCSFKTVTPQLIKNYVVLTCVTSPTYLQLLSLCHDVTCTLHSPSLV